MSTEKVFEEDLTREMKNAVEKLRTLLNCGNDRVELSAAKELLSLIEAQKEKAEKEKTPQEAPFQIEIVVRDA